MARSAVCVLRLPLLSRPGASVVWGRNTQKGIEKQLPEKLGTAFLSWSMEREAGEVQNQLQQENRNKPDVAPHVHALIPTKNACLIRTTCLQHAPAEKRRVGPQKPLSQLLLFDCCPFVRPIYDGLCRFSPEISIKSLGSHL